MTVNRFRITRHAQNDMFPATRTYPVKAVPSARRKITAPESQIRNFACVTTLEKTTDFPIWKNRKKMAKLAPSMWTLRRSQTKFPSSEILRRSRNCRSSSYETRPRSMNPVTIWRIQKRRTKNAMECPAWICATGKSATS